MLTKNDLTGISIIGLVVVESLALATGHNGLMLVGTLGVLSSAAGFGAGFYGGSKIKER